MERIGRYERLDVGSIPTMSTTNYERSIMKIGFSGVPGAGKTSLARMVAATMRGNKTNVELVSEYARRYLAKYNSIDDIHEQVRIFNKQLEWEDQVGYADIMLTDSVIFLGFLYALELRKETRKDAMYLADLFKEMVKLNTPRRYDIVFHAPPILTPVRDGIRSEKQFDPSWREAANLKLLHILDLFPPKHLHIIKSESIEDRTKECTEVIMRYGREGFPN